ncbi:cupin domain-containing protein [Georgenia sp. SUBG003]|uniref:cupin domain-containing protein n=1 Tax=Georgenia sp. SUBG003 TaxID=1497974 RepID=UPI003AB7D415
MIELHEAGLDRSSGEPSYEENLRVADLSLGTYSIPAGSADPQQPHTEDEIYVVLRGAGRLWTPDRTADVRAGSVLFVPAGEEHRFVEITEDLTVLVVFGPAERTRSTGRTGGPRSRKEASDAAPGAGPR